MGADTKIEWCDYTFSPWRGCTKVSAGCANCYADTLSRRNPGTMGVWGPNGTRVVSSEAMWKEPVKWDRHAASATAGEKRPRVFCASLADVFEDWQGKMVSPHGSIMRTCQTCGGWLPGEPPVCHGQIMRTMTMQDVRERLFALIDDTPNLDWLILTKRPENIAKMMPQHLLTGYNKANGTHSGRNLCVSSSPVGGTGDRRSRSNLESSQEDGGSLDRGSKNNSVPEGSSRDGKRIGLPTSQGDEGREKALCGGSPTCLDSLQGSDTERHDCQPQEGQQVRQQAGRVGVGDLSSTTKARAGSAEREPQQADRIEAPEDVFDRGGRSSDSSKKGQRRTSQEDREGLPNEAKGGECDLLPKDLDTSLTPFRPNVWLGVSVENRSVLHRIDELRKTPAAVRFLSIEPLLEDLGAINLTGIHWVIVGGESGPGARPMNVAWAQSVVDQCKAAGVPVFMKQLGRKPERTTAPGVTHPLPMAHRNGKGGDPDRWPESLRVREFPAPERN